MNILNQPSDREYSIEDMLKCVERELALRKIMYPKWVNSGVMKEDVAKHEINVMQAIHETLYELKETV
jgi:hypothetical protein